MASEEGNTYHARAARIAARIDALASISDEVTCLSRMYGTRAFREGSLLIQQWMQEAGLQTRVDAIGNVRGRWNASRPNAKTLVIASHMDTVVNAGKFDGPLGILMGLDLLENQRQLGQALPFHVELIAFCDEEGVRFHTTYLGSKVVAGAFNPELLTRKDASGTILEAVVRELGCDPDQIPEAAMASNDWLGYFEIHIEQGPVLYESQIPVGIVTDIAGQKRVNVSFTGVAGHAGTVPMHMRQDAFCAAAAFALEVERIASARDNVVATVGKLDIVHAASNVIPGLVRCSVDVRSPTETTLTEAYLALQNTCLQIGKQRGVTVDWQLIQETAPVSCDAQLTNSLASAIEASGYHVVKLVSGAGHDGVPIAQVSPIAMLFVRCYQGISHNPLENVDLTDLKAALVVADRFLAILAERNQ